MSEGRPLIVTRADPGGTATVERAKALGLDARHVPLFAARPVEWMVPAGDFDALLLTSAQAIRLAGARLGRLAGLPVYAVGAATAAAAEAAGLAVAMTGARGAQTLIDAMASQNIARTLWLCARDRSAFDARGMTLVALPVYTVDPVEPPAGWTDAIAAPAVLFAHSARGAQRIADLAGAARGHLALVAISAAVAEAAGGGWAEIAIAGQPDDASMLAAAHDLCQKER
jgi:uroporphyrinogen-III synthase